MKIAILTPWSISPDSVGGTERFVIDLAESLKFLGNDVDVYMLSGKEYTKKGVNYLNINLFNTEDTINEYFLRKIFNNFSTNKSYNNIAISIEKLVDFKKYDLIQINSQLFLKVCENKKRVFTIHTNPFEYKLDWGDKSFSCMLNMMKNESEYENTKFVAPSIYYSKEYSMLTGVKINYIPHGIDVSRLASERKRESILKDLNIDLSKNIILLPSRLEPIQKQPMLFMKAFSKLNDFIKEKYTIVCTGADKQYLQYKQDIEQFCKENKIDIVITRFKDMADAFTIADVVALPSQSESFGYAALESLSLGIMTIMNNIPTFKEVSDGSLNSIFFNNSVDSLYEILNIKISKKTVRKSQPKSWREKYSLIKFGQRYLDLYKK